MASFMLLLSEDPNAFSDLSPEQIQAVIERYNAWREQLQKEGRLLGAEKLIDEGGRILSRQNGKMSVIDGPFSEAKEVIGGYFALKAQDYEEAAAIAEGCPHLDFGTIHLRQIDELH